MDITVELKKTKELKIIHICDICLKEYPKILKKDRVDIIKSSNGRFICNNCFNKLFNK